MASSSGRVLRESAQQTEGIISRRWWRPTPCRCRGVEAETLFKVLSRNDATVSIASV